MNVLAVFRSRTQSMEFYNALKGHGITAQLVSAPKQANVGCALACKIPYSALPKAKGLLLIKKYSTFVGFFKVTSIGNRKEIARL